MKKTLTAFLLAAAMIAALPLLNSDHGACSDLSAVVYAEDSIVINIRPTVGGEFSIEAALTDTISSVKAKIYEKTDIPPERQYLRKH